MLTAGKTNEEIAKAIFNAFIHSTSEKGFVSNCLVSSERTLNSLAGDEARVIYQALRMAKGE